MMGSVIPISSQLAESPEEPVAPEQKEPTVAALIELCERLDQGLQLASTVIAQLDLRIRKLELAENKRLRKLSILKPGEA